MKTTAGLFVIGTLLLAAGCSARSPHLADAGSKQFLIFDRIPGDTYATDVGIRRAWPTADAGAVVRQTVDFTEYFVDRQGRDNNGRSAFNRRFSTRRRGLIVR